MYFAQFLFKRTHTRRCIYCWCSLMQDFHRPSKTFHTHTVDYQRSSVHWIRLIIIVLPTLKYVRYAFRGYITCLVRLAPTYPSARVRAKICNKQTIKHAFSMVCFYFVTTGFLKNIFRLYFLFFNGTDFVYWLNLSRLALSYDWPHKLKKTYLYFFCYLC